MKNLGRYEIIEEIGRGAMGVIYKSRDPLINRIVALKTMRLEGIADNQAERDQLTRRFYREAEAAGKLMHPNIVAIFDVGKQDETPYIAMEYVEGKTLADLLSTGTHFSLNRTIDIVSQICAGLNYAHENNVVHRDIKPANIILMPNGQVKIADFGIAKLSITTRTITISGTLLGTPGYLSPEQIEGREVDHRSDIFSLGAVLYELITGKRAFDGETIATLFHQIINLAPPRPSAIKPNLLPELDGIIGKAMAKSKDDRYQKAIHLAEDLRAAQKLPPYTHLMHGEPKPAEEKRSPRDMAEAPGDISGPIPEMPKTAISEPRIQGPKAPELRMSATRVPEPKGAEPKAPEQRMPEPKIPEPGKPEQRIPEPRMPEPKVPEQRKPEPRMPEPKVPEKPRAAEPMAERAKAVRDIPVPSKPMPRRPLPDQAGRPVPGEAEPKRRSWLTVGVVACAIVAVALVVFVFLRFPAKPKPGSGGSQTSQPEEPIGSPDQAKQVKSLMDEGKRYFQAKLYDLSLEKMREVLSLDPDHEEARLFKEKLEAINLKFHQGFSLYKEGRFQECVKVMSEVLQLDPGHKEATKYKDSALEILSTRTGFLSINVFPWGKIFLDDQYLGEPPIAKKSVQAGEHTIRIMRDGYKTVTQKVVIQDNLTESVSIDLEKM